MSIRDRVLGEKETVIYGKGYIEDTLCGCTFRISPKSFYQVNPVQTEILYMKAIEYAGLTGKERIVDAYCGIGTIGLIAASKAKEVISVELNRDAVRDAVTNAKRNDIKNVQFYNADAGQFMVEICLLYTSTNFFAVLIGIMFNYIGPISYGGAYIPMVLSFGSGRKEATWGAHLLYAGYALTAYRFILFTGYISAGRMDGFKNILIAEAFVLCIAFGQICAVLQMRYGKKGIAVGIIVTVAVRCV